MTEAHIQQQIVIWFTNKYCLLINEKRCLVYSVPNDSINAIESKRKKNTGMLKGVSDLVLLLPNGKSIFVEVKFGSNTQSDSQKEFQARVQLLGFEYWLVYSLEQFQKLCEQQLT